MGNLPKVPTTVSRHVQTPIFSLSCHWCVVFDEATNARAATDKLKSVFSCMQKAQTSISFVFLL